MSREKWVSTPYVTEQTGQEIVMGHTGLPVGLDIERIQWNVDALRRGVIGWGGYQALDLAAYRGDEDKYNYWWGDVDDSGVGHASATVSVSRAESSSFEPSSDAKLNQFDMRNGVLAVGWNINALNDRILTHEQFDPLIRARQLNQAVKQAAIRGVWTHNIGDVFRDSPTFKNSFCGVLDTLLAAGIGSGIYNGDHANTASGLMNQIVMKGVACAALAVRAKFVLGDSKNVITDPLLFSCRPTRAALGIGTLAASKLVRTS